MGHPERENIRRKEHTPPGVRRDEREMAAKSKALF